MNPAASDHEPAEQDAGGTDRQRSHGPAHHPCEDGVGYGAEDLCQAQHAVLIGLQTKGIRHHGLGGLADC